MDRWIKRTFRPLLWITVALSLLIQNLEYKNNQPVNYTEDIPFLREVSVISTVYRTILKDTTHLHEIAFFTTKEALSKKLPPLLVAAIIYEESRGTLRARGRVGEKGLMQVYPKYWQGVYPACGKDLYTIKTNICYGTNILALSIYKTNSFEKGIMKYNGSLNSFNYLRNILSRYGHINLISISIKGNNV